MYAYFIVRKPHGPWISYNEYTESTHRNPSRYMNTMIWHGIWKTSNGRVEDGYDDDDERLYEFSAIP